MIKPDLLNELPIDIPIEDEKEEPKLPSETTVNISLAENNPSILVIELLSNSVKLSQIGIFKQGFNWELGPKCSGYHWQTEEVHRHNGYGTYILAKAVQLAANDSWSNLILTTPSEYSTQANRIRYILDNLGIKFEECVDPSSIEPKNERNYLFYIKRYGIDGFLEYVRAVENSNTFKPDTHWSRD